MKPYQARICKWTIAFLGGAYFVYSAYYLSGSLPPMLNSFAKLQEGQKALVGNPDQAAALFDQAGQELATTTEALRQSPELVRFATVLPPFRWQVRLIKAGYALSQTGKITADLARTAPRIDNNGTDVSRILSSTSVAYSSWYHRNEPAIDSLDEQLRIASDELHAVPPWIAFHRYRDLHRAEATVAKASEALSTARHTIATLEAAMGADDARSHTFLVLFQNNAELRTTGGFIGSYALITAQQGTLSGFRFGTNIYKIDKAYSAIHPVPPPKQLQHLTSTYAFRDSNIEDGFLPAVAPRVADQFSKETGTAVDGVLLVDTTILEDIVGLTGPVELPTTKGVVTADAATIRNALTTEIERDYFTAKDNKKENEPKQIIADLIPILMAKVQAMPSGFSKLVPLVKQSTERKGIQVWMTDTSAYAVLSDYFPPDRPVPAQHWVKTVNNNLGANKSSTSVYQTVEMRQKADAARQRLSVTLTITHEHRGSSAWPDGINQSYLEVYIPQEATIVSAPPGMGEVSALPAERRNALASRYDAREPILTEGQEWKRASFWMATAPGKTSRQTVTYTLPLTPAYENRFTYVKQAGIVHEKLEAPSYRFAGDVTGNLFLTR